MCLMETSKNPLEVGVRGSPEEVRAATLDVLKEWRRRNHSFRRGASSGNPRRNIERCEGLEESFKPSCPRIVPLLLVVFTLLVYLPVRHHDS